MREMIYAFLPGKARPQSGTVQGKYYTRTGGCNQCGRCCEDIYLIHNDRTIDSAELFEELKPHNPEYEYFEPVRETSEGIQFKCKHLGPDKRCTIYAKRPDFCRNYPSEKSILLGGNLAEGCGYSFELIRTFQDVLAKTAEKKTLKPGKLLS